MHLKALGKNPNALQVDCGKEFNNEDLLNWCKQQGIEIQFTAPYSPSQNRVAERLNQTLLELARAMVIACKIPIFLWEYAISHAMYLRNRVYHKALPDNTPYQLWYNKKPDISHLQEFGAPVWILLEGQKKLPKMQPRSKQYLYVGCEDGSKSVLYYSAETRKVLIF